MRNIFIMLSFQLVFMDSQAPTEILLQEPKDLPGFKP